VRRRRARGPPVRAVAGHRDLRAVHVDRVGPRGLGDAVDEAEDDGDDAGVLAAADGDDDGAIHGDDVNRAFRAAFVGVVARWSSRCRVVVGEVPGRRRHGGAGVRTCEDAA